MWVPAAKAPDWIKHLRFAPFDPLLIAFPHACQTGKATKQLSAPDRHRVDRRRKSAIYSLSKVPADGPALQHGSVRSLP